MFKRIQFYYNKLMNVYSKYYKYNTSKTCMQCLKRLNTNTGGMLILI